MSLVVIVKEPPKISARKRKRDHYMKWAVITHRHMSNSALPWMYLLQWAALGGTAKDLPV